MPCITIQPTDGNSLHFHLIICQCFTGLLAQQRGGEGQQLNENFRKINTALTRQTKTAAALQITFGRKNVHSQVHPNLIELHLGESSLRQGKVLGSHQVPLWFLKSPDKMKTLGTLKLMGQSQTVTELGDLDFNDQHIAGLDTD